MAFRYRILLLGGVFLLVFAAIHIVDLFPFPKDDVLTEKTSGFSGVLRLWISEENSPSPNGLSAWLTRESVQFEKKYDGVYVQITPVSKKTLESFSYAASLPPDMIVFSPGMLSTREGLFQAGSSAGLREEFQNYASGSCTPIAMGASFWAIRTSDASPLSGKTLLFEKGLAQSALYALKRDFSGEQSPGMRYGVDLGLPIYEKDEKIIAVETGEIIPGKDSFISENALSLFIKGKGDALFLSSKKLPSLINATAAPDFNVLMTGEIYAELLSLFAITDTKSAEARAMCEKFLEHLLSEEAQKRLESSKAFSVTGAQIYAGKAHFQEIEMLLSSQKIIPAPAFSHDPETAESALASVIRGEQRAGDSLLSSDSP